MTHAAARSKGGAKRPRILSTGPNSRLLWLRNAVLASRGYEVVSANRVADALRLMESGDFDVVVVGHTFATSDQIAIAECARSPVVVLFTGAAPPRWTNGPVCDALMPEALVKLVAEITEEKSAGDGQMTAET